MTMVATKPAKKPKYLSMLEKITARLMDTIQRCWEFKQRPKPGIESALGLIE